MLVTRHTGNMGHTLLWSRGHEKKAFHSAFLSTLHLTIVEMGLFHVWKSGLEFKLKIWLKLSGFHLSRKKLHYGIKDSNYND